MPTPYLEQDEGSVESIADLMSELPDEVLTGVTEEKDAADEAQASDEPDAVEATTEEAPKEEKAEPEKGEAEATEELSDTVMIGEDEVALTDLVDAYQSRQSDSVQVEARVEELTQEARAEVARQVQPMLAERQELVTALERVKSFNPLPAEPDASLLDSHSENYNPDRYHQQRAQFDQASRQMGEIEQHIAQQRQAMEQQHSLINQQEVDRQADLLRKAWPEVAAEGGAELVKGFASDLERMYGIDAAMVDTITDHRFYLLARDALTHRRMGEKTPEIRRKAAQAPKLIKSGAKSKAPDPSTKAATEARKKLAKSGNLVDAAAAFEQYL